MSKREKKTVLYSRNGIKIEKTEHIDMTKWSNMMSTPFGQLFADLY